MKTMLGGEREIDWCVCFTPGNAVILEKALEVYRKTWPQPIPELFDEA
jgi:hypothetical protein